MIISIVEVTCSGGSTIQMETLTCFLAQVFIGGNRHLVTVPYCGQTTINGGVS